MSEGLALHKMLFDETGKPIDYVILEVNPAFEELTGVSAQDCAGCRASEIFGTGSAPYLQEYAAVVRTGHPFSFEVCFSPMNRHFRISAFSPEAGQFVTVFMDISDRKQAEEALAAEKEHLAVTLRSIGDGVITTDVDGKVVMLNHIAEELTGWSNVEAANRPLSQVMPLVDEQTNEPITQSGRSGVSDG